MTVKWKMPLPFDVLDALTDEINKAPALVQGEIQRRVRLSRKKILEPLQRDPGPPHYPIRWKSEKQRKAFFATNGFGRGIPSKRTGQLQAGWEVDIDLFKDGGEVGVANDVPYARYVQGDDTQPFHLDTGWSQAAEVTTAGFDFLEDQLIETWFTLVDEDAGIPR